MASTTLPAERLRILYSFPHSLGGPGIGTTAWNQVRGLATAGHDVTLCATSVAVPLPAEVNTIRTLAVAGRRVPHRALGIDRAYRFHDRLTARIIRRSGDDFDLVHAWPRGCLMTLDAARARGLATFRESPSPHTASAFEQATRAAASVGLRVPDDHSHRYDAARLAAEEAEYAACDFILAPSDYVTSTYLERGISPRKLVRHRYGADLDAFAATPHRTSSEPFTAVFVGRGEPLKGLHTALRAWRAAELGDEARFLIAGDVEAPYRQALAALFEQGSVVTLGFRGDIARVLQDCDILLLPSVSEGSTLVTFEALASGVVPLVSTASGAPIIDGVDGFLHEVGDEHSLSTQITRLYRDRQTLARMRAAALERRDDLSWEVAARALVDASREGLDRHHGERTHE